MSYLPLTNTHIRLFSTTPFLDILTTSKETEKKKNVYFKFTVHYCVPRVPNKDKSNVTYITITRFRTNTKLV